MKPSAPEGGYMYIGCCDSPLGRICLLAEEDALCGLWFEDQRYFPENFYRMGEMRDTPIFSEVRRWLDAYFEGRLPDALPPMRPRGTEFQRRVWQELTNIPYGAVTTYGELAARLKSSPRAVGGAVGHNPISILIPCHRVIGADGSLTGYAGGTERKEK